MLNERNRIMLTLFSLFSFFRLFGYFPTFSLLCFNTWWFCFAWQSYLWESHHQQVIENQVMHHLHSVKWYCFRLSFLLGILPWNLGYSIVRFHFNAFFSLVFYFHLSLCNMLFMEFFPFLKKELESLGTGATFIMKWGHLVERKLSKGLTLWHQ